MAKNDTPAGTTPDEVEAPLAGKGRPTPSRKEAQAAKAQPLVGSRDKVARKAQRKRDLAARDRARLGMMQGDERYLTQRDRGPQRRFVRDYVDARINIGEYLIPMAFVMLLASMLPGQIQIYAILAIWVYLFIAIIDAVLLGLRLKRKLAAKFGENEVQSGFRWYAAMRAMQFRMLRVPKPQVKRFQFPK